MDNKQTLSLSMIVRNEATTISGCIQSVKKLVNEIIVVDTGSNDGTIEIAQKLGAKVFQFPWGEDFSAARNFALSKCTGSYILYLDADEEIDGKSVNFIKNILQNSEPKAHRCTIKSKTGSEGRITFGRYCRLFPNVPGLKFTGRAHEQIESSLVKNGIEFNESEILIIHHGYDTDDSVLSAKAERNLPLLLEEFQNNPDSYFAYQIGQTYSILDKDQEAKVYFEIALDDPKLNREYKFYALQFISNYFLSMRDLEAAEETISKLIEIEPNRSSAYLLCSKIYAVAKKWEQALLFALSAFEKCKAESDSNVQVVGEKCDPLQIGAYGIRIAIHAQNQQYFNFFTDLLNDYFTFDASNLFKSLANDLDVADENIEKMSAEFPQCLTDTAAMMLKSYERPATATRIVDSFIAYNKVSPDVVLLKSDLLNVSGQRAEAIEFLENRFKDFPRNPGPALYLLSYYLDGSAIGKIEPVLEFIEAQFSDNPDVLEGLNMLLKKAG